MNNTTTPLYARLTAAISRPLVLISALVISMPAEIGLARSSGFNNGFEFLMPLTLSLYSAASAMIAAGRPRGSKGRVSAIAGSGVALGFALSAQVVGHLISSGYMTSGPVLVSLVSSVPAIAAAHILHLAAIPKGPENKTVGVTNEDQGQEAIEEPFTGSEKASEDTEAVSPAAPRKKGARPSLQAVREAADNLDCTGQKVTAKSLAAVFKVSERSGARYLSMLKAA
ncbi:hypothetical protein ACFYM5_18925 [Streptomyces sp. NPDC006706]|uniref:hypothetical protein n=1 Tax=Streptomyces sp. NPDC006706 TaxID=3364761 RepID=UPI0036B2E2A6